MKLKYLMVANAVGNVIFGIGLVVAPGFVLSLFSPMPMYIPLAMQLLGTSLIGIAVLLFFARNAKEGDALLRPILLANLVSNGMGFVLSLVVQLGSTATATNWFTVVVTLVFSLGYGYFLLESMRTSESPVGVRR